MTYKSNKGTRNIMLIVVITIIIIIIVNFKVILKSFFPLEYEKSIIEYSHMYNVDPNLVAAVINTESKFLEDASSSKGAIGLMQIMPDTGKWIAETLQLQDFNEAMIKNPELNIRMGTWYLSKLSEDFKGDYTLTLAAYNGGPGNVTKWLENEKYSSDGENLHKIPFKETKNYVQRVRFNHRMYRYLYNLGHSEK
ncbi:lytic transglycosylase domain-containing protein [Clostridium sp. UBA1056]|uniref:lytic transglycosylase domain-containing protein n=1 Tax=unclassified Clostridium TaxID=2614128 RepID=UPI0032171474